MRFGSWLVSRSGLLTLGAALAIAACSGGSGVDAPPSMLVAVEAEAAGENCSHGGLRIAAGADEDEDGTLAPDEVTGLGYVCDAAQNVSLGRRFAAAAAAEPAGAGCAAGGQRLDLGHDDDADGVLEPGEIDSTIYLCGGELLAVTEEAAGADCPAGGNRIEVGVDSDESGTLEASEVARTARLCFPYAQEYAFTGDAQELVVPAGVNEVFIEAVGAQGGGGLCVPSYPATEGSFAQDDGGLGGLASGYLAVSSGQTLRVFVGGKGVTAGAGGFNGGGAGGQFGAGGGGATDVRLEPYGLEDRVLVAAGGGGGNCGWPDVGEGGDGGGLIGSDGVSYDFPVGAGATQTAGGAGTANGELGAGGGSSGYHVGGGGGGYYGGGGAYASGGGGGSSYLGGVTSGATEGGQRAGDGGLRVTLL
jgi:hypothetical protein